jgi:hypothetical protein
MGALRTGAGAAEEGGSSARVRAGIGLLIALAGFFAMWPVWRALFPLEIDGNEPWNAYWADAARSGTPLYPDVRGLLGNDYPPLSFYVIAMISGLGFDAVMIGRWLSLVAILAAGGAAGWCVRSLGGGAMAALVSGAWYVATMTRCFDSYAGMDDPHLPATALMTLAMGWLLDRRRRGRAGDPAIAAMAVAGFYKHTLIATPLCALLWIGRHDRRAALRAALVGGTIAAAGLAFCAVIFGRGFFDQLLFPRETSLARTLGNLGELQWIAPALVIWAIWAWHERARASAQFSVLYVATAFVAFFLQKMGVGVAVNAQFELVVATAIGLGLAFDRAAETPFARRFGTEAARLTILGVVVARLVISNHVEPLFVLASPDYRAAFHDHAQVVRQEVARIRAMAGPVVCDVASVCRQAGKAFVYDPFAVERRLKAGTFSSSELAARLAAAGITFVSIDARARAVSLERRLFAGIR